MHSKTKQLVWGLVFGIAFGFLLHKGGVTKYDVIIAQLLLEDFTVVKIMMSAVLVGAVGLHIMRAASWIDLDPKKGSWGRNAVGGLIFGLGFAVLGYCPGTIAGAIGNGYLDAAIGGLAGILLGSWLLAAIYPRIEAGILGRGSFPALTLPGVLKVNEWVVIVPLGALILLLFHLLER
jgi:uncharacterized protein